jgi:predicted transcriptional regulator YdeE
VIEPRIEERKRFAVLGTVRPVRRGSETPELFAGIWREFESLRPQIERLAIRPEYYGVSFATDKDHVTDYLAGMMVGADAPVPKGLERRTVPGGQFAVFQCPVATIAERYRYIFTEWLPGASVDLDPSNPVFEEYPEGTSVQSISICVPIRQKSDDGGDAG